MDKIKFTDYVKFVFSKDCKLSTRMELFHFFTPIIISMIAIAISIYTIIKLN